MYPDEAYSNSVNAVDTVKLRIIPVSMYTCM